MKKGKSIAPRTPDHPTLSGQSMVEVAVTLPFLILIVIALIEMGIVFASYISLVNATREGAVFASMYPQLSTAPNYGTNSYYGTGGGITNTITISSEYTTRISNEILYVSGEPLRAGQLIDQDILTMTPPVVDPTCGINQGCPITVTVSYQVHTFTSDVSLPYFGRFGLPNYYLLSYTMGMPIR